MSHLWFRDGTWLDYLVCSPETWPPLMDNPWISDSLPVFWAKRWHIGKWLAGDIGMLFGTFFASGMYHECSAYILGIREGVRLVCSTVLHGTSDIAFGGEAMASYHWEEGGRNIRQVVGILAQPLGTHV
ncbi:hypothetical protein JVT61DRAFT_1120 [Boletus reticuloceps]|uniref:Uncharacterized protein n=1 Tax=Boletus reticuloceps TaxID=495285 RepID=A0A8I2YS20_9AGAM|nr:hypothetical protein JVT61DRAFT_1120 [Boletus reticuloceps]